jgi:hypothetical protein
MYRPDEEATTRRALSPDARLISRLAGARARALRRQLEAARAESEALAASGAHPAALVLKRVEIVRLEDALARNEFALLYRNPDA